MNSQLSSDVLDEVGATAVKGINRHHGLAEEAYDAIFARLMALRITPGSRITVDNLARELNVSQTPIREALGRLEGEGLVIKTHLIGYSAAQQISRHRFDELYDLRLLLEPEAAARAGRHMDERKPRSYGRLRVSCPAARAATSAFATPPSPAWMPFSMIAYWNLPATT